MTATVIGQIVSADGFFRTVQPNGLLLAGWITGLAPRQLAPLRVLYEHDHYEPLGRVLHLEHHPRSGTWAVGVLDRVPDDDRPLSFSPGGTGDVAKDWHRPGPVMETVTLENYRLDEVSLTWRPGSVVGRADILPFDITADLRSIGFPMGLSQFKRSMLERCNAVVQAAAKEEWLHGHRRSAIDVVDMTPAPFVSPPLTRTTARPAITPVPSELAHTSRTMRRVLHPDHDWR